MKRWKLCLVLLLCALSVPTKCPGGVSLVHFRPFMQSCFLGAVWVRFTPSVVGGYHESTVSSFGSHVGVRNHQTAVLRTCLNSTRSRVCCLFSSCSSAILILLLLMRLKSDRMSRKRALRRPSYVRYVKGPDLRLRQSERVFVEGAYFRPSAFGAIEGKTTAGKWNELRACGWTGSVMSKEELIFSRLGVGGNAREREKSRPSEAPLSPEILVFVQNMRRCLERAG